MKKLSVFLLFLLIMPVVLAADSDLNTVIPQQPQQGIIVSVGQIGSMITDADQKLYEKLAGNNDANFRQMDNRFNVYMGTLQTKIILVIIGIQLLVSGIVYYLQNKNMRDLSYQSINLKRKKEAEDRAWMVDSINYLRGQSDNLAQAMKSMADSNLFNLEQLARYRREQDGSGDNRAGGAQQPTMAEQYDVQGHYSQGAQGWVPDGDQYEQQAYNREQPRRPQQQAGPGFI